MEPAPDAAWREGVALPGRAPRLPELPVSLSDTGCAPQRVLWEEVAHKGLGTRSGDGRKEEERYSKRVDLSVSRYDNS